MPVFTCITFLYTEFANFSDWIATYLLFITDNTQIVATNKKFMTLKKQIYFIKV